MATVIEIVAEHLRSIGADGLVQTDAECGCEAANLAPCQGDFSACQPGWRGIDPDSTSGDWAMYRTKEAAQRSIKADDSADVELPAGLVEADLIGGEG